MLRPASSNSSKYTRSRWAKTWVRRGGMLGMVLAVRPEASGEGFAEAHELRLVDRVSVLGRGEGVAAHLARVLGHPGHHLGLYLPVAFGEPGGVAVVDPEQVVEHQDLSVGGGTGADADDRDLEPLHDRLGHRRRDRFEHDCETAGLLERKRVACDGERALCGTSLGLVPAQG